MSRTLTRHHDHCEHGPALLPLLLPLLLLLLLVPLTAAAPRELVPATDDGPIRPPAGAESIASAAPPPADIARSAAAPSGGYVRRGGRRVAALRPADLLHFRQLVAPRQRWRQRPDVSSGGQRVLIEISSAAALTAPGPLADGGEEEGEEEEIMPRRSTVRAAQEELLKKAASAAKDEKQRGTQEGGGEEEERDVERRQEEAQNEPHDGEEEEEGDLADVEGSGFHEERNTATPATMPLMPLDEERDEPVAERPVAQTPDAAQEAVPEPVAEAMAEHMPEPVAEPVAQHPMAMHAAEPVEEPVEEPVAEPVAEESASGRPASAGQGAEMTAGSTPDVVMSRPDSPPSGGTGAGHVDAVGHGDGDDADDDADDDSHTGMAAVLAGAALPAASVVDSGSAPGSASGPVSGSVSGSAWSGAGPSHPVSAGGVLPVTVSTETVRREARGSAPDQRGQLSTAEISAVAVGCVMAAAVVILGAALVVQRTGLLQRRSILSEPPLDDTRLSYINASTDFSVSELGDEMTNLENLDNDSFLNSLESMTDSMAGQTCWSREVRHLKL